MTKLAHPFLKLGAWYYAFHVVIGSAGDGLLIMHHVPAGMQRTTGICLSHTQQEGRHESMVMIRPNFHVLPFLGCAYVLT